MDPERIGGIGLSVGGEMMIEEAARNDALKAIVSEGAGIRSVREAREVTGGGADKWLQVVAMASMTAGTAIFSNHSPPGNLKDLVQRISPRPIFLIYAARGQGGEELSADFYEAAGRAQAAVEDRQRARWRVRRRPQGVRAASCPLLQERAVRAKS